MAYLHTDDGNAVGINNPLPVKLTGGSNVSDYGTITTSDTANLPKQAIAIAVAGTAGDIAVVKPNGDSVVIPSTLIPVGQFIPFTALKIKKTGTTATNIWVMYG